MASGKHKDIRSAASDAYSINGKLITTPFLFPGSPYNEEIKNCKNVFEIGCGIGRNIPWWMENTSANYFSVDPNTYMLQYVFDNDLGIGKVFKENWKDRVYVATDFDDVICNKTFDVVISTFVFQHLGYRFPNTVDEITQSIKKQTRPGTIWILVEHEWEEPGWIERWAKNNGFDPFDLYIKNYNVEPWTYRGLHDLIIIKQK